MEYKSVFFAPEGAKGLSETSANHLCAVAAHLRDQHAAVLENVNFINSFIDVVGSNAESKPTKIGMTELTSIDIAIKEIGRMNAFISWFAEGRSKLEELKNYIEDLQLDEWLELQGIEKPNKPVLTTSEVKVSTMQDIINEMSIKDRQIYLALEAQASVYGKFVHAKQPMDRARTALHNVISQPYTNSGLGRDTIITYSVPSIDPEEVDKEFNKLQYEYRQIEQKLNHMKVDIRKKLTLRNTEENNERRLRMLEYNKKREVYDSRMQELTLQFGQWVLEEKTRLSKIKLAIPEGLVETYNFLQNTNG